MPVMRLDAIVDGRRIVAVLRVRMMIVVNGRWVAGDRMNDKEAAAARRTHAASGGR